MVKDSCVVSFSCMWLLNFSNIIYSRAYHFSTVCSLFLCHKLFIMCTFIVGFQFCCTNLYICYFSFFTSSMLCWLLWLCEIVWNESVCYLQVLFPHRIAFAIWDLLWFHINFRFFLLYFCEKCSWDFNENCIESVDL